MELEHLATLERLRQSQRQDYLKVSKNDTELKTPPWVHCHHFRFDLYSKSSESITRCNNTIQIKTKQSD